MNTWNYTLKKCDYLSDLAFSRESLSVKINISKKIVIAQCNRIVAISAHFGNEKTFLREYLHCSAMISSLELLHRKIEDSVGEDFAISDKNSWKDVGDRFERWPGHLYPPSSVFRRVFSPWIPSPFVAVCQRERETGGWPSRAVPILEAHSRRDGIYDRRVIELR